MSSIGTDTPILDGEVKVRGALRFCGDLVRPGMLHARLVTSPHAHARLIGVDTTQAAATPGVVAVMTADDLPDLPAQSRAMLLLGRDRVIFVGHPVALVLAESEAAAQDGAELVSVSYQPLPSATAIDAALAADAPAVWPQGLPGQSAEAAAHGADGSMGKSSAARPSPNVANQVAFSRGDLEVGFAAADCTIEREFRTAAVHQSYLEPHVAMVELDPMTGGATVWSSTQGLYFVRDAVAAVLGVQNTQVRAIATPVGGGFGGKFLLFEPLLALAAKKLNRPVRLMMTRLEEMLTATPAPATRVRLKVGARSDGTLTALDAELVMDNGCFPSSMAVLAGILLGSIYKVPHQRVTGIELLTFRPSAGAYRAPCAPQSAFALETVLDEIAQRLGIDPLELRLKNAVSAGDPMATEQPWPSIGMKPVLEALQAHPAWQQRDQARAAGRGVGIAIGGWPGGTEPAAAACRLESDGTLTVQVGSVDITGTDTTMAMIAAETFGVDPKRVRMIAGDTTTAPYAGASGGSKVTYTVGPAVIQAATEARRQTLELAAQVFEADPADLEIRDGKVQVKGSPDRAISLAKLAQRTMRYGSRQAPIWGHGRDAQMSSAPGFCAQLAEVEVDRETGRVQLHRLVVVQDVGRAINPLTVRGQMMGGAVQGIGWALYEQMAYDDDGQLMTATFNDYAVPHSTHAPALELVVVEVPSPSGPFGAKGVGEPPVIPTAAAIANAIADATGTRLTRLPMSAPRVRDAIRDSAAS